MGRRSSTIAAMASLALNGIMNHLKLDANLIFMDDPITENGKRGSVDAPKLLDIIEEGLEADMRALKRDSGYFVPECKEINGRKEVDTAKESDEAIEGIEPNETSKLNGTYSKGDMVNGHTAKGDTQAMNSQTNADKSKESRKYVEKTGGLEGKGDIPTDETDKTAYL